MGIPDQGSARERELDKLTEFSGEPFTAHEMQKLRRLLRDEERMTWFWATIRVWGAWGGAIATFVYMFWDHIVRAIKVTP